jgi:hypothetical protein
MEAREMIRYRLLNYLIEAHECQPISANVAIVSEIAEADWSQVKDILNELFLYGDIVMTKDNQPYRSGVNAGWFFHVGNFQIKATVRGRREYGKLQILMEKDLPAGQAEGLSPSGSASSEQV